MDHDRPGVPAGLPVHTLTPLTAGHTILLVEDDAAVRGLVGDVLRDEGYAVIEIPDGSKAIAALQAHCPPPRSLSLVILDMMLPGADGVSVLGALADLGDYVPVIAMSADRGQLTRAMKAGARSTVAKPFDLDQFLTVVGRTCCH